MLWSKLLCTESFMSILELAKVAELPHIVHMILYSVTRKMHVLFWFQLWLLIQELIRRWESRTWRTNFIIVEITNLVAMATSLKKFDNVSEILDPENPHIDTNSAVLSVIEPELWRFEDLVAMATSLPVGRSSPKFNRFFPGPLPTFPENVMQIRSELWVGCTHGCMVKTATSQNGDSQNGDNEIVDRTEYFVVCTYSHCTAEFVAQMRTWTEIDRYGY